MSSKKTQTLAIKIIVTMDGCTVKQEFASDSKTTTSLGSKAHLENINKTLCFNYCATAPPKISIQHQKSEGKHL